MNVAHVVSRSGASKHCPMRLSILIIASLICFAAASADKLAGRSADAENPGACPGVTSGIEDVSPSEPIGVGAGIVLDEHLLRRPPVFERVLRKR